MTLHDFNHDSFNYKYQNMKKNIKISYPSSEKIYMKGEIYPDLRVGMRRINLTPTVINDNGKGWKSPTILCSFMTRVDLTATRMWK